jgi:hypothetical protein
MFVRWKTRIPQRPWYKDFPHRNPGKSFSAELVRSERVDGKPRQKIVAYLGHMKEKHLAVPLRRYHFWEGVDRQLAALVLSPAGRQRIEERLSAVVARATVEEVERSRQEIRERLLKVADRV